MTTDRPATYSYAELADRIEQVLGERLSLSSLRAAPAQSRRTETTLTRPRLTVGLPAPLPPPSRTAPAAFAVAEIEDWLRNHPRLAWNHADSQARTALANGEPVETVVATALEAGLSWRHLTNILNEADGGRRSTAGVHKKYRHLAPGTRDAAAAGTDREQR